MHRPGPGEAIGYEPSQRSKDPDRGAKGPVAAVLRFVPVPLDTSRYMMERETEIETEGTRFPCVFHVNKQLEVPSGKTSENETQVFLPGESPAVPDVAHQLQNVSSDNTTWHLKTPCQEFKNSYYFDLF